jgi:Glycosyl transferase family 2
MAGATGEEQSSRERAIAGEDAVRVDLESPLPRSLPAGSATAIFCAGICFDRTGEVELEIVVDGVHHRPAATRMPRPDVFAADGHPCSYRSGWWSTVQVTAPERPGAIDVQALIRRSGRSELLVPLAQIAVVARKPVPAARAGLPKETIAVCMATYNPDPALFAAQVDSLLAQTEQRWICLVSDDCSDQDRFEQITEVVGGDERFVVSRSQRRLGFYRNFERALELVPEGVELIALCDQDDRWHPDKLRTLRAELGRARMVYSDLRLVDARGRILRETMWVRRRNNCTNLASLLVANSVTGAAMLLRRSVAELALPFPDTPGLQFHDHWLALVALASGKVAYVDRPLYDYVQHPGAVFGEVSGNGGPAKGAVRGRRSRGWRAAYFCGYLGRAVQAQALLVRCSALLTPGKRRALERYVESERRPVAFAWLLLRPLRRMVGRNETLGSELELVPGILWRWLIVIRARLDAVRQTRRSDAAFPDPLAFEQKRLRRWRARA